MGMTLLCCDLSHGTFTQNGSCLALTLCCRDWEGKTVYGRLFIGLPFGLPSPTSTPSPLTDL